MQKLKKVIKHPIFILITRVLIGGLFVIAGLLKLMNPIEEFIAVARQWEVLFDPWLTWYIQILPWAEVVFGALMIVGAFLRTTAVVIALITLSFLIAIVVNLIAGRTLEDCGCFGNAFEFGSNFIDLFIRDTIIMIFTLILVFTKQNQWSVDKYFQK